MPEPIIFYDQKWFRLFRRFHTRLRKKLIDKTSKVHISHLRRSIKIENSNDSLSALEKTEIVQKLERKLLKIRSAINLIEKEEQNKFVKDFYTEKYLEEEAQTKIFIFRFTKGENEKIQAEINKLFPLPIEEDLSKFINEFIFFLYKLRENNLPSKTNKLVNVILDKGFFEIDYKEPQNPILKNWKFEQFEDKSLRDIMNRRQILKEIRKTLNELGIRDKTRIRKSTGSLFSVSTIYPSINVPKEVLLSRKRAFEIITHEIKVHLLRSLRGRELMDKSGSRHKMYTINSKSNLDLEEGLATFYEQNLFRESNKYDLSQLFQYYIRVIGVYLALKNSPYEVYSKIKILYSLQKELMTFEQIDPEKSAQILIKRLYSDFKNLEKGYVNPKVAVYLFGNRKIWELKENGFDIEKLMVGKVGLNDLENLY